ncbi:MAG: T9SS type A sorting domain-containing protein, partial [Bacteroidia bacterium]
TFPSFLYQVNIDNNPYNCLPNYVLPAMASYTTTSLCVAGNSNGCPYVTGIEQIGFKDATVSVYPNPTNGQFTIETNTIDKQTIQIVDLNGRLVFNEAITGTTTVDATNLNEGVYTLTLKTVDRIMNKKLVIVH